MTSPGNQPGWLAVFSLARATRIGLPRSIGSGTIVGRITKGNERSRPETKQNVEPKHP
jgi:hypothetical protein